MNGDSCSEFMKHLSSSMIPVISSAVTTLIVIAAVLAIASVNAAPTQAPPTGNPTFPLTGPAGPIGPQGPQGISGATAVLDCTTQSQSFSGQSVTVSCGSGYVATGGGFYLSDGDNNGLNWNNAWAYPSGSNSWQCGRNIYSGLYSTCTVRCCRIQ